RVLLRRNRCWNWRGRCSTLWTARRALLAFAAEFLLPLNIFVEPYGHVLDHDVLHAQAAFEFRDQFSVFGADLLIDVNSFAMLGHAIGQLPRTPMLGLLDLSVLLRNGMLERGEHLLDVFFRGCRPHDENQVVQTFLHIDLVSLFCPGASPGKFNLAAQSCCSGASAGGTRRLKRFIAAAIPCFCITSTASAASAIISAAVSSSAFFIAR